MVSRTVIQNIVKAAALAALMFSGVPVGAQNSEWFCPSCGKSGNKDNFCFDCGYGKPADGVLPFDDKRSANPSDKWCVSELKDFENSGLVLTAH